MSVEPDDVQISTEDLNNFSSIVKWMRTVIDPLEANWSAEHLKNCRLFAEVLHKIDDDFFSSSFLEKIQAYDISSNWRVKANNFRKVLRSICEYYTDFVHRDLSALLKESYWNIDEYEFVNSSDLNAMVRLMVLIVGAAFLGRNNNVYVSSITSLTEDLQKDIAGAVMLVTSHSKEIEVHVTPSPRKESIPVSVPAHNGAAGDMDMEDRVEQVFYENERLKKEIASLTADREKMETELASVQTKLSDVHRKDGGDRDLERELRELRFKKDQLAEQLFESDSEKEGMRSQLDVLTEEKMHLESKLNSISQMYEDFQRLKDENEMLKICENENAKHLTTIEQLKQKAKETNGLVSENKVLKERLDSYLESAVHCDDLKQKNDVLRRQMASYKIEIDTKEKEARELTLKLDKVDFELAQAQERINILEGEKKRLSAEKAMLEEERILVPLHSQLAESHSLEQSLANPVDEHNANPAQVAVNMTERLSRLQIENSRLKEKAREADELEVVRHDLDTSKSKNNQLETELRLSNKKNLELQAKLDSLENSMESCDNSSDSKDLRVAVEKATLETSQWREKALKAESQLCTLQEQDSNSQGRLTKELAESREELETERRKMREYLEKARQVIVDQEARSQVFTEGGLSRHEFDSLRREIEQKEKRIRQLETQSERTNTMHEQEQRLITTAFYKMTQDITTYQRAADAQSDSSREKSFLSRQRQTSTLVPSFGSIFVVLCFVFGSLLLHYCRPNIDVDHLVDRSDFH